MEMKTDLSNQRQQPQLNLSLSDGLANQYQIQESDVAALQLAPQSSGGQRSKILLYQKPNMTVQNNAVQSQLMSNNHSHQIHTSTHQNGFYAGQGGSSAVSSVSNTAYGTLYQDQASNRLQSQYFKNQHSNPHKQLIDQKFHNKQQQQHQMLNNQRDSQQHYGALAQGRRSQNGTITNEINNSSQGKSSKNMGQMRSSMERQTNLNNQSELQQQLLRNSYQQNPQLQNNRVSSVNNNDNRYSSGGGGVYSDLQNKKSYQILKKPITAQNQRAKNIQDNQGQKIGSPKNFDNAYQNQNQNLFNNRVMSHSYYSSMNYQQSQNKFNGYGSQNGFHPAGVRSEYMNDINNNRPLTMGGQNKFISMRGYQPSDDNRSTLASEGVQDPRRLMKLRKQKLQSTFYDTLKQGQKENHSNTMNSVGNINSHLSQSQSQTNQMKHTFADQFGQEIPLTQDLQNQSKNQNQNGIYPELNLYNQQISQLRMASGLSLKQNNLKYHLMRQLLQKKSLEEITVLQAKMQQQQREQQLLNASRGSAYGNSKLIKFPGMKQDLSSTPMTKEKAKSESSSSSESSISEDVEPFVEESKELPVTDQTNRNNLNVSHSQQTHYSLNKDLSSAQHDINKSGLGKAQPLPLSNQLPTSSHSALGLLGPDGLSTQMGVMNNHININIIKAQHSRKNSQAYPLQNNNNNNTNYQTNKRDFTLLNQQQQQQAASKASSKLQKHLQEDKLTQDLNMLSTNVTKAFKKSKKSSKPQEPQCQITKYNYCGVPSQSFIDAKNRNVHLRKERMNLQRNLQINRGCSVFNTRSKKADINLGITQSAAEQYEYNLRMHQQNRERDEGQQLQEFGLDFSDIYGRDENMLRSQNLMLRSAKHQNISGMNISFNHNRANSSSVEQGHDKINLSFALGSLENKQLDQNVKLTNYMTSQLSYQKLIEKSEIENQIQKEKKVKEILKQAHEAKLEGSLPDLLRENYARLKKAYPNYGQDIQSQALHDEHRMQYIDKNQKIFNDLKRENVERQKEYEQIPMQEPVYVKQSTRQGVKSASSAGRKSLQSGGAMSGSNAAGGHRAMILKELLVNSFNNEKNLSQNTTQDNRQDILHSNQDKNLRNEPIFTSEGKQQLKKVVDQDHDVFKQWGTINANYWQLMNTSKFGDFHAVNQREEDMICHFIFKKFPIIGDREVHIKIAKLIKPHNNKNKPTHDEQHLQSNQIQETEEQIVLPEYNALLIGQQCPLSSCCKLSMSININLECGTGKLMCMERLCQFNPLLQFLLPIEFITNFYENNLAENQQSQDEKPQEQSVEESKDYKDQSQIHNNQLQEDVSQMDYIQRDQFINMMNSKRSHNAHNQNHSQEYSHDQQQMLQGLNNLNSNIYEQDGGQQRDQQLNQLYNDLFQNQENQNIHHLMPQQQQHLRKDFVTSAKSGRSKRSMHSKQHELINQELTKNVADGSYRFKALRNVVSKGGSRDKSGASRRNNNAVTSNGNGRSGIASGNNKKRLDLLDDNTTENDYEFIEINSEMLEKENMDDDHEEQLVGMNHHQEQIKEQNRDQFININISKERGRDNNNRKNIQNTLENDSLFNKTIE